MSSSYTAQQALAGDTPEYSWNEDEFDEDTKRKPEGALVLDCVEQIMSSLPPSPKVEDIDEKKVYEIAEEHNIRYMTDKIYTRCHELVVGQ